jgi:hypothetical protein
MILLSLLLRSSYKFRRACVDYQLFVVIFMDAIALNKKWQGRGKNAERNESRQHLSICPFTFSGTSIIDHFALNLIKKNIYWRLPTS